MLAFSACDTENNVPPEYENYFVKYYGGNGDQTGEDHLILDDGFALVGTSISNGNSNVFLVRTDLIGNEAWSVEFGGGAIEANAITRETSGNFVVVATNTVSTNDDDIILFRISPEGAILDSLAFGEVGEVETATDVTATGQGDIVITGTTTAVSNPSRPEDFEDIYSIKLDANLVQFDDADWRRKSGLERNEEGVSILEKSDGTFGFFGSTNIETSSPQQEGYNMIFYPAASDGQAISAETLYFGTLGNETGAQMVATSDGGFVMIGTSTNGNENDIYLARVRSNNEFLSAGRLNSGKNLIGKSILESQFGGLLLLGREIINNTGDIYLAKASVSGAILWERSFGGIDDDYPGMVKEMADGSIVFVCTVELESQTKMCLIKTTASGELKR